ncbi:BTB/POZ domain-containing protein kctd15 [Plakobranchus ocellatus]|uniref:BTB/POZ domain-containing protein kctd15 n=1 Tax=Plakobranchus ocellatus TaxID=259542 RepID=A0AAV4BMP7_9GAST|nr:BTB/POZ domain-containing protein kctd15 [Plakobranchus ocellatus]
MNGLAIRDCRHQWTGRYGIVGMDGLADTGLYASMDWRIRDCRHGWTGGYGIICMDGLADTGLFYELGGLLKELQNVKKAKDISNVVKEIKTERIGNGSGDVVMSASTPSSSGPALQPTSTVVPGQDFVDCIAVSTSPDLGERICLSAERPLIEEVFPELTAALMDTRNSGWSNLENNNYVIRFPLNGFCKLNSIQVLQRLLNHAFVIAASSGGGVEGQQFSEYLFTRTCRAATH